MLEYSLVTWALAVALLFLGTVRIIPGPVGENEHSKKSVIELFLTAYKTYYDSFYFVLNLPIP